ncbi:MAG: alpha/beta hydrolase family protein, partial [Acidimicrobiales bacterium]
EYGGGAWCLLGEPGAFAYVEQTTQQVMAARAGDGPAEVTAAPPAGEQWHHGGLVVGPAGSVLGIRERHHPGGVERSVVRLDPTNPARESVLCKGRDFYGSLAPSPDGTRLAWVTWDHPDMPWDATELWVGELALGGVELAGRPRRVGAGPLDGASVDQPLWLDDDTLAFVADPSGWWRPWRWRRGQEPEPLSDLEADFQGPAWTLGQHTIAPVDEAALGCSWRRDGLDRIGVIDRRAMRRELSQPCVAVSALCGHAGGLAWLGSTPAAPSAVWWAGVRTADRPARVAGSDAPLADDDVSVAESVRVRAPEGHDVHAIFYAPRLAGWRGPAAEAPPLVVQCHGGPTAGADAGFDPLVQMLTTRGYAVAVVNYRGSTGYGRDYRRALDGRWGEADVDDCAAVAGWLAERGRVDGSRMAIRGQSAGGLTALNALVRSELFAAVVSWYGVTDLVRLAETTHDFESRYTDRLIGPLPAARDRYTERSPLHRVDEMTGAVLLLQGEDDPVVPPEQARSMAEALQARGVRCELRFFAGESHGFRKAETLVAAFEAELAFYREVLLGAPGGVA